KLKGRARRATVTINRGMMTARIIPKSTPLGIFRPPSPFHFFIDLWRVEAQQQYREVGRQCHHQDLVRKNHRCDNPKDSRGKREGVILVILKRIIINTTNRATRANSSPSKLGGMIWPASAPIIPPPTHASWHRIGILKMRGPGSCRPLGMAETSA